MLLFEFVTTYRDAIITKTKEKVSTREWPAGLGSELENGVPLFLTQLSETLQWEGTATPFSWTAIGTSAARHGSDLLAMGFNLSQVVHVYGDICQAVTELALQQNAPITTNQFHILNRCLDTAIAEAVAEHGRITAASRSSDELERTGQVMHEVRNGLNTALIAIRYRQTGRGVDQREYRCGPWSKSGWPARVRGQHAGRRADGREPSPSRAGVDPRVP